MNDHSKIAVDFVSWLTIAGAIMDALPHIAALLSVIWGILRLWEMWTGKSIADRRKKPRMNFRDNRRW